MNKWLGIGVLGLLSAGAFKLFHLKQFSDKLMINLSNPRIHKIDSKGLAFRTEILLQNPTKYQLTITKPYITITTNGKFVSGSTPEQKVLKLRNSQQPKSTPLKSLFRGQLLLAMLRILFSKSLQFSLLLKQRI